MNRVVIVAADGATTIGTSRLPKTPHFRPGQAKAAEGATLATPDVRDLRQTTETTGAAAMLPVRVRRRQTCRTRKT